jgi:hypothetical protein
LPAVKHGRDWWIEPADLELVRERPTGYPKGKRRTHAEPLSLTQFDESDIVRFWDKVKRGDGCWEWTGCRHHERGYGYFAFHYQLYFAHRVAWHLTFGPFDDALMILHHCDNPMCCRPDHLFIGTGTDNMKDMASKGRCAFQAGEANHIARLTWPEVRHIRHLFHAECWTIKQLSERFGVGRDNIEQILHGYSWKDPNYHDGTPDPTRLRTTTKRMALAKSQPGAA